IDQARPAAAPVVNIHHHPDNRRYGDVNWIHVSAAATGEMVYELLVGLGAPLTPPIATNLFTALHTDTGSFRYSNVTPRTFRTAAALVDAGAAPPSSRGCSTGAPPPVPPPGSAGPSGRWGVGAPGG